MSLEWEFPSDVLEPVEGRVKCWQSQVSELSMAGELIILAPPASNE